MEFVKAVAPTFGAINLEDISANSLKSSTLPSITGIAAWGPMSPNPSTAVPSEITATALPLMVSDQPLSMSSSMAMLTRARVLI